MKLRTRVVLAGAALLLVLGSVGMFTNTTEAKSKSKSVYFRNCTAAKNAGYSNIQRGQPGYRRALDRDNDGIACER